MSPLLKVKKQLINKYRGRGKITLSKTRALYSKTGQCTRIKIVYEKKIAKDWLALGIFVSYTDRYFHLFKENQI